MVLLFISLLLIFSFTLVTYFIFSRLRSQLPPEVRVGRHEGGSAVGGVGGGVAAGGEPRADHPAGPQPRRVHRHRLRHEIPGKV